MMQPDSAASAQALLHAELDALKKQLAAARKENADLKAGKAGKKHRRHRLRYTCYNSSRALHSSLLKAAQTLEETKEKVGLENLRNALRYSGGSAPENWCDWNYGTNTKGKVPGVDTLCYAFFGNDLEVPPDVQALLGTDEARPPRPPRSPAPSSEEMVVATAAAHAVAPRLYVPETPPDAQMPASVDDDVSSSASASDELFGPQEAMSDDSVVPAVAPHPRFPE